MYFANVGVLAALYESPRACEKTVERLILFFVLDKILVFQNKA